MPIFYLNTLTYSLYTFIHCVNTEFPSHTWIIQPAILWVKGSFNNKIKRERERDGSITERGTEREGIVMMTKSLPVLWSKSTLIFGEVELFLRWATRTRGAHTRPWLLQENRWERRPARKVNTQHLYAGDCCCQKGYFQIRTSNYI